MVSPLLSEVGVFLFQYYKLLWLHCQQSDPFHLSNIPGFRNGYRTIARPRAVFIDFAFTGDSDHMPSSGLKLELHLQVVVLLPDVIEATPSAVADEEPAQAVCDRVVEELWRLIHLSRDLRDMVRERLELRL